MRGRIGAELSTNLMRWHWDMNFVLALMHPDSMELLVQAFSVWGRGNVVSGSVLAIMEKHDTHKHKRRLLSSNLMCLH